MKQCEISENHVAIIRKKELIPAPNSQLSYATTGGGEN